MYLSRIGGIAGLGLFFVSIIALTIIIERSKFWLYTIKNRNRVFNSVFQDFFNNQKILDNDRNDRRHIVMSLFRSIDCPNIADISHNRKKLDQSFETIEVDLQKYDSVLTTVIAISPLIGLLGTVLGLIRSLQGLTLTDLAESNLSVIAGISEALISTAIGLTIAVICLVALNLFRGLRRSELRKLSGFVDTIEQRLDQLQ